MGFVASSPSSSLPPVLGARRPRKFFYFREFRGLHYNAFATSKIYDFKVVACFVSKGNDGFMSVPRSDNGDTVQEQSSYISAEGNQTSNDMLQMDAIALGTISADVVPVPYDFSVDDELDLDCPSEQFSSIFDAIEDIRQGKFMIVVDDEDQENEGNLIMAGSLATPEAMAFIVKHGIGIVCVSMKEEDIDRLQLPLMVTERK